MQNAGLERNTHPSNRAAVPAGTGIVEIPTEVASGTNVDMSPVHGTRTTTETSRSANSVGQTTRKGSCLFPRHALTQGSRLPRMSRAPEFLSPPHQEPVAGIPYTADWTDTNGTPEGSTRCPSPAPPVFWCSTQSPRQSERRFRVHRDDG